jgi:two-component system, NarL family, nitrate/nitrite response regulator NarL
VVGFSVHSCLGGIQVRRSSRRHRLIPTVIVDKSALFRAGLIHILAGTRFRVIPGCSSLKDIEKSVLNYQVSLVLVSLDKDAQAVLSDLSSLREQFEYLRVVIFSERFHLEELLTAVASGVDCYLLKNEITPDALLKSLDLVLLGETILPRGFTQLLRGQLNLQQEALTPGNYLETRLEYPRAHCPGEALRTGDIVRLSNKEQVILFRLTQGASNKHIARELEIAEATVKTHVKALLHKISVRNRTQAAVWATNYLGQSCLHDAKSLRPSAGLRGLLDQLGGPGLDLVDEPTAAHLREAPLLVGNDQNPVLAAC